VAASVLVSLALYLAGTPLLSLVSSEKVDGSMTVVVYQTHWPLLAVCAAGFLGVVVLVWPRPQPPRIHS
jgi:hypothetical protein